MAFHYFLPELAKRILADCVAKKCAVFVFESGSCFVWLVLSVLPVMLFAIFANLFLASSQRVVKSIFMYLVFLILLVGLWDVCVSAFCVYMEDELWGMVELFGGGYMWEYYVLLFAFFGWVMVFLGLLP